MQLSERIKKVLDEQRLDQPSLGKIAGVTKATVNQWVTGKIKSIKMEYAVRIQERYGYSTAWLVMGKGPERLTDWPFVRVDRDAFNQLPAAKKLEIENYINFVIQGWKDDQDRDIHHAA